VTRRLLLGGLRLHLRAWLRAAELDRRLAGGADPMDSDELSLRVGRLGSTASRSRFATALRGAVDAANGRHPPLVATRLRLPEIRDSEDLMLALADRLRDGGPLGVVGLAMTSRLVNDHESPLRGPGRAGPLHAALSRALAALECGHRTAPMGVMQPSNGQPGPLD
jgi:hypothetical protein